MADTLAGVDDLLEALKTRLGRIQKDAVKAVQTHMQPARADVADGFAREFVFDANGKRVPVLPFGAGWARRKAALGLDRRRGHAAGGVQRVLDTKSAAKKTANGFILDFRTPAASVTSTYRRRVSKANRKRKIIKRKDGKPLPPLMRKVKVATYLGFFTKQKAPTLGNIPATRRAAIRRSVSGAVDKALTNVSKSIKGAAGQRGGYVLKAEFDLFIGGARS